MLSHILFSALKKLYSLTEKKGWIKSYYVIQRYNGESVAFLHFKIFPRFHLFKDEL